MPIELLLLTVLVVGMLGLFVFVLVQSRRGAAVNSEAAEALRASYEQQLAAVRSAADLQIADRDRQLSALRIDRDQRIEDLRAERDTGLATIRAERDAQALALREERDRQVNDLRAARERDAAEFKTEQARLNALNSDLRAESAELKTALDQQSRHHRQELATQAEHAKVQIERLENARKQMTDEFKAVAGDVLKAQSETFTQQNREQVDLLLKPLGEKIVEFQTGLLKDRAELVEQVRALHASSLNMTQEATNLTRALKGNAQTQGAWGEMILTSILERSGLKKGEQFRVQESHATEDGRVRTDVELFMPNGDKIIIDSKVSLNAFEAHVNASDEDERLQHLKSHVASVRGHIKTLGSKEYHRHAQSGFDFVLMFVPIEAAFVAAVSADGKLLDDAFGQNVFIATPTTLMSALRAIRNVWQIENRQRNAEEIAERAGRLYDKVVGFLQNMDKVESALESSRKAFDAAKGQLATGPGSVVRQIEMLKAMGAKTSKPLPSGWEASGPTTLPLSDMTADSTDTIVETMQAAE